MDLIITTWMSTTDAPLANLLHGLCILIGCGAFLSAAVLFRFRVGRVIIAGGIVCIAAVSIAFIAPAAASLPSVLRAESSSHLRVAGTLNSVQADGADAFVSVAEVPGVRFQFTIDQARRYDGQEGRMVTFDCPTPKDVSRDTPSVVSGVIITCTTAPISNIQHTVYEGVQPYPAPLTQHTEAHPVAIQP